MPTVLRRTAWRSWLMPGLLESDSVKLSFELQAELPNADRRLRGVQSVKEHTLLGRRKRVMSSTLSPEANTSSSFCWLSPASGKSEGEWLPAPENWQCPVMRIERLQE